MGGTIQSSNDNTFSHADPESTNTAKANQPGDSSPEVEPRPIQPKQSADDQNQVPGDVSPESTAAAPRPSVVAESTNSSVEPRPM